MAKHLQRDLDDLQRDLLALAGLVEAGVGDAAVIIPSPPLPYSFCMSRFMVNQIAP